MQLCAWAAIDGLQWFVPKFSSTCTFIWSRITLRPTAARIIHQCMSRQRFIRHRTPLHLCQFNYTECESGMQLCACAAIDVLQWFVPKFSSTCTFIWSRITLRPTAARIIHQCMSRQRFIRHRTTAFLTKNPTSSFLAVSSIARQTKSCSAFHHSCLYSSGL
jgi:hypothetical protein